MLIDGMPQMGDVPGTKLRTVINTRSIILYDNDKQLYFLRVQDWWLQATPSSRLTREADSNNRFTR
jgi:hypothetical protein